MSWSYTLRENCLSFSQLLTVANSSMPRGEHCAHLPFFAWFGIAFVLSSQSQPGEVLCAAALLYLEDTLSSWSSSASVS